MADLDNNEEVPASSNANHKKRSRVQFSCTACRYRKLKCDRTHPCDRCTRRGDAASCTYVGHGPRGRPSHAASNPSHIQSRMQHLENLILSFAQQKKQQDGSGSGAAASWNVTDFATDPSVTTEAAAAAAPLVEDDPGKILNNEQMGTTYVDSSHWRAILDDINEVKKYLHDDDVSTDDGYHEEADEVHDSSSPALLFYSGRALTKEELIADLPERSISDRLMARFLNSGDPTLVILHFPTFQREYDQFWLEPENVSLPWLGLLYASLTMSVGMYRRSLEPLPGALGDPIEMINRLQRNCCQCLISSNYTKVGKLKVEALLMYATTEYSKKGNAPISVSLILGIAIKLAMRMGYHRDPKHYSNISAFEGEMRRRSWAVICQLDALTAFQVGVPKHLQPWQSDTELPHNLFDEDFDENTVELPPSRPESVRTVTTYTISKSRIMDMFGRISDLAYSRKPTSYEEILELDRKLEEAHESMASSLRMKPMNQSLTDDETVIMKRYTLDVLYQKARIVLHRKYLTEAHHDSRLNYSRWVCINAAKEALRHQHELFHESQVGGRLYSHRWFFTSLQNHDFVLAAMVICLELAKSNTDEVKTRKQGYGFSIVLDGRSEMLDALEKSRDIWRTNLKHSVEARKAFDALTIMLKKAQLDDERRKQGDGNTGNPEQPITKTRQPAPRNTSPARDDDIAMGESASSVGYSGSDRRDKSTPSHRLNTGGVIPTPPVSNTSTSTGNGIIRRTTDPASLDAALPIYNQVQEQPFQEVDPSLSTLDVIQSMIDAPSNPDWQAWDGHMQDFYFGALDPLWDPSVSTANGNNMENSEQETTGFPPYESLYFTPGERG
ncbi:hypothetical protein BGW36DRAFT_317045 [Talaromyces proteolyticus]|uniref:Zn(2)-C6 fungal-type domain-containing protein n=1 Tax=Talaromyces proteolyticus TaxID=1131652 RepID=A0AAD4L0U7_9EURO|nr:uncharacterized protein BGW36DRAFT_317045 [Talaromyces proteolyticus]KAH8700829.1 hypothetical protein BGW36DRAFT_317045 [Talaromyces proteolyticus]